MGGTELVDKTVREQIHWAYANLARAHAALSDNAMSYSRRHHIIRNKMFHGLMSGNLEMGSLYDDERVKVNHSDTCCYCGDRSHLTIDHLIPRVKGGVDMSDNLVWACKRCNSSKRGLDLMAWMNRRHSFPSIFILRRYLKLVYRECNARQLLDLPISETENLELPFDIGQVPQDFPGLDTLSMWVKAREET